MVKGRRGTLYHLSSTLEKKQKGGTTALDDVKIRRRFATSRYFLSPAGILKLLVIILFLIAATLFLSSESCPNTPDWYTWLYPLASLVTVVSTSFLYAMFMLGMAEDNPSLWVKLDMAVTLTEAVAVSAISIITITECKNSSFLSNTVLGPLGLTGAALMALSTAATYIMWRYRSQQLAPQSTPGTDAQQKPRVSIFI